MSKEELEQLAELLAEKVALKLSERAQRRYLSREEYSQAFGLGVRTIDRAIAEGRLSVTRTGRRVLIPADAIITNR